MAEDKKITAPSISLPKGGGAIKGIGETFQPNPFNGTGNFSIPIYTSPCRGFEPKLSLNYSSGSGNDIFGLGFSLSIPNVSRKTEKGLPKYQDLDADTFILSNAEDLVPYLEKSGNQWVRVERNVAIGNIPFKVTRYRPRTEGLFAKIELWQNLSTRDIHWEVTSKDNIKSVYGKTSQAKIIDPDDPVKVFKWLIEETSDAKGNKILYAYKSEDEENVLNDISEVNRSHTANKYIKRIKYGNYFDRNDNNREKWAFEVVFDYGEHTDQNDPYNKDASLWPKRSDSFSSYRSGFEIRTHRLCRRVLMFHHFPNERGVGNNCLVKSTDFTYEEAPIMTFLKAVTQKGYKRNTNGSYDVAELPPVEFTYSTFNPTEHYFKPLTVETDGTIPGLINQSEYLMVDLYGEGISGILYSDDSTVLYWRGRGNGSYAEPQIVHTFPIESDLRNPQLALMDLGGDGKLDLVVQATPRAGFYQSNPDGTWEPFKNFESYPVIDFKNPARETVDLNGDGFADILQIEDDSLTYYPSKAKKGYDDPVKLLKEQHDNALPGNNNGSREETIRFADMFGDGLSHRVRIRNGIVECWPNLGYGRFGKKVLFRNAPRFEGKMDASRLFFADTDGSGTTDLIYVHEDRIDVYFNQSGNSFSDSISIPLPQGFDNLDQIQIADILGNGTSCVVVTKNKAGYQGLRHDYYDFSGGIKPHLLIEMTNNMGATTRVRYASSTKFYLEDERAGKPWISRLPFPVHLIEKTETVDHISGSKLVTCYKYHHGFYDGEEREFRGFGCVEQWDTESFGQFSQTDLIDDIPFEVGEEGLHVPPVHTITWFHTGAYESEGVLSRQYESEYYDKNPGGLLLPDSVLDEAFNTIDNESIVEAHRALRGQVLRQEVYADDKKPDLSEHPYTVTESNFKVRLLQPKSGQKHAVFFVYPNESISYHYERISYPEHDPRIEHDFTLDVDKFGNVLKSAKVFYPRRQAMGRHVYPEQAQVRATVTLNKFINETNRFYLLGVTYDNKTLEIGGLNLGNNAYFTFEEIDNHVKITLKEENMLRFDQKLSYQTVQSRLLSWQRHYFWDNDQNNAMQLGFVTERALLHHTETAILSRQQIHDVFDGQVTDAMLRDRNNNGGGYTEARPRDGEYDLANAYWWNPGLIQHYYKENHRKFFLPLKTEDPFGEETIVTYDKYCIAPIEVQDPLLNITKAEINYIVLQPKKLTDINDNVSDVIFDPLGLVTVTSIYGSEYNLQNNRVETKGDEPLDQYQARSALTMDDVLNDPVYYLQDATSYFYYDLFAWKDRKEPVFSLNLLRETHVSELRGNETSEFQYHIAYSDGFGREHQKKLKVEPGKAFKRDADNKLVLDAENRPILDDCHDRWLVSGRTVYNNKAKPVKQYEPFYSCTPAYEKEKEVTDHGVTPIIHYDPLLRVIKTDTPKGFFSKIEFTPWMQETWDENDTMEDSAFYRDNSNNTAPTFSDQKDALDKASRHYNTPQVSLLNNLGQRFQLVEKKENGQQLVTYYELDIQGNELTITDPRQYNLNRTRDPQDQVKNFVHVFDMTGTKLSVDSVDAGLRRTLNNVLGKPIHSWDSNGYHIRTSYDELQRPEEIHVAGNGLDQIVERLKYGEGAPNDKDKNLRGKLIEHYDQAGIQFFDLYDIKGAIRITRRKLRKDYENEVNWNARVDLEIEEFTTKNTYDALWRIKEQKNPDNNSLYKPKFHQSGLLKQVEVQFLNEPNPTTFVQEITYNAKGQREKIVYGNGVVTEYTYERETFRLLHLYTYLSRDGKELQDIYYTYDPVGNITRIIDHSHKRVFHDQSVVDPRCDYTYDALYQLTIATGREHPSLSNNNYKTGGFKHSQYLPFEQPAHSNDFQQLQNYTENYTYDDAGNLIQIRHTDSSPARIWTRNITPSETSNRAVPEEMLQGGGVPDDFFDANGNLIELEHLDGIRWNYRNNIASIDVIQRDDGPPDSEYYVYDSAGNRVRKVSKRLTNGNVIEITEKIYVGNCEIKRIKRERNNNTDMILERKTLHVMDDKQRIALVHHWTKDEGNRETDNIGDRKIHYQLSNHLGSSSLEVNDRTEIISYEEYFPYGGTAFIAGRSQDASLNKEVKMKEYRYSGKERDDSTGLYYYGARYYAPWLGRWMSCDPAGLKDGPNLFAFCSNSPLRLLDINGRQGSEPDKRVKGGPEIRLNQSFTGTETREQLEALANQFGKSIKGPVYWEEGYGWRAELIPMPISGGEATGQLQTSVGIEGEREGGTETSPNVNKAISALGAAAKQVVTPQTITTQVGGKFPGEVIVETKPALEAFKLSESPVELRKPLPPGGRGGGSVRLDPGHAGRGSHSRVPHVHGKGEYKWVSSGKHSVPSSSFRVNPSSVAEAAERAGKVLAPVGAFASGYRVGTESLEGYERAGGGAIGVAMGIAEGGRAISSELAGWGGAAVVGLQGAAIGLKVGSFFGPWGMIIGTLVGLIAGGLLGYLAGRAAVESVIDFARR